MTDAAQQLADGKEKLAQGVREIIQGAEDLLRSAASYSGEGADAVRARLVGQVDRLKDVASSYEESAAETYRMISSSTDSYVRDKPWQAVGIAVATGVVIGALLARR
ncbi:MAG: hypothetical protein JWL63_3331 [Rhodocyclales bacterium]|nr:hypothetical protein [Rhodocyclales bacterium]